MKYRTIVADPPWPMADTGPRTQSSEGSWEAGVGTLGKRSSLPYDRMSIDEIAALPIPSLAESGGAHLYLWTFGRYVPDAYALAEAWGFRYSALLTWCGFGFRRGLRAERGACLVRPQGRLRELSRCERTWFEWKRPGYGAPGFGPGPAHSAKPDAFLDLVEQVSPGPYLEMFARRARFGWDYYGDQSLGTAEMPSEGVA